MSLSKTRSGHGGRQLLADDRLHCALVGHDHGTVILENLGTADVIGMAVRVDDVFH
jgi:hypothetical protein